MKNRTVLIIVILPLLAFAHAQDLDFPKLTGPFLGQAPPMKAPVLFAPGIVSSSYGNHSSASISPDGREIYWAGEKRKIWFTRLEKDGWTRPEMVSFCARDSFSYDNPFITTDGKKLFFTSTRPEAVSREKETIWYAERSRSGWMDPVPVASEVNELPLHWSISVADVGTLYFQFQDASGKSPGGIGDIYYSELVDSKYQKPFRIGHPLIPRLQKPAPILHPMNPILSLLDLMNQT